MRSFVGDHRGRGHHRNRTPGPWVIPDEVLAVGDQWYVDYTGAGPWVGPASCSGGMEPGIVMLRDYLQETLVSQKPARFPKNTTNLIPPRESIDFYRRFDRWSGARTKMYAACA